jgi:hypothetical protein
VALIVLHFVVGIVLIYGLTHVVLPVGWWAEARQPEKPPSLTQ